MTTPDVHAAGDKLRLEIPLNQSYVLGVSELGELMLVLKPRPGFPQQTITGPLEWIRDQVGERFGGMV